VSVKCPKPDYFVWLGLFMGREAEETSRRNFDDSEEVLYVDLYRAFGPNENGNENGSIRAIPILEAARNILRYLAEEAEKLDGSDLLKFCAVHGLSGAVENILEGKYDGHVPSGLDINTPLLFPNLTPDDDYEGVLAPPPELCLPVMCIAAVLGYTHMVRHSVQRLGADLTTPMELLFRGSDKRTNLGGHAASAEALVWVILANNVEMVKW